MKQVGGMVRMEVGHIQVLIQNAGVVSGKNIFELKDEEIKRTIDINTTSHFWTIREFLPEMVKQNFGSIVTV